MTDNIKCNIGNGSGHRLRARNDKMVRSYAVTDGPLSDLVYVTEFVTK
jgi:hypothetical protein